ncbi:interleukin 15, like isoform X2 [Syngnathus acus]|uniref:interleukin 15, like isoform X2 n=1 Tax=Syngnathus acus TaxID=161584 RepID=UPI001885C0A8|nr:interleukin 15, like isoform X2 [Syngnathus acus]
MDHRATKRSHQDIGSLPAIWLASKEQGVSERTTERVSKERAKSERVSKERAKSERVSKERASRHKREAFAAARFGSGAACLAFLAGEEHEDDMPTRGRTATAPAKLVVTVCVLCLACLLRGGARAMPSLDLMEHVKELLRDDAASCSDCKLYTPTWSDYKTCPKDTLKCFSAEVRVLVTEWERSEGNVLKHLERGLKFLEDGPHNQNQSACGPCELHPEENVQHFLQELQRILERINSAFSAIA